MIKFMMGIQSFATLKLNLIFSALGYLSTGLYVVKDSAAPTDWLNWYTAHFATRFLRRKLPNLFSHVTANYEAMRLGYLLVVSTVSLFASFSSTSAVGQAEPSEMIPQDPASRVDPIGNRQLRVRDDSNEDSGDEERAAPKKTFKMLDDLMAKFRHQIPLSKAEEEMLEAKAHQAFMAREMDELFEFWRKYPKMLEYVKPIKAGERLTFAQVAKAEWYKRIPNKNPLAD